MCPHQQQSRGPVYHQLQVPANFFILYAAVFVTFAYAPLAGACGVWPLDDAGPRGALVASVMDHLARGVGAVSVMARGGASGFFAAGGGGGVAGVDW